MVEKHKGQKFYNKLIDFQIREGSSQLTNNVLYEKCYMKFQ